MNCNRRNIWSGLTVPKSTVQCATVLQRIRDDTLDVQRKEPVLKTKLTRTIDRRKDQLCSATIFSAQDQH